MKKLLEIKLKFLAKLILDKYKPEIIGVTGSVGKTSAKEAAAVVLAHKYRVRQSAKNYNNEIGLPLTIIGVDSPGKNIFGWIFVFLKAAHLLISKKSDYPEILILEMGVDRPGDMDYLLEIAKCRFGILTRIGHSHFEFFSSLKEIQKEKFKLLKSLPASGAAVINGDDELCREIIGKAQARLLVYGFSDKAEIKGSDLEMVNFDSNRDGRDLYGQRMRITYNNKSVPVFLYNVIGRSVASSALAGAAIGIAHGLSLEDISVALVKFSPPKGRMRLIPGIKGTLLIDDSYNSSPQSASAALAALKEIPLAESGARRLAVLGDMLELGSYTAEGHEEVGKKAAELEINELVVVGERAVNIIKGAVCAGFKEENIFHFPDSKSAGIFVQNRIKKGDVILIKGSQGVRMERIVKEVMAEPLKAGELLVRQDKKWLLK